MNLVNRVVQLDLLRNCSQCIIIISYLCLPSCLHEKEMLFRFHLFFTHFLCQEETQTAQETQKTERKERVKEDKVFYSNARFSSQRSFHTCIQNTFTYIHTGIQGRLVQQINLTHKAWNSIGVVSSFLRNEVTKEVFQSVRKIIPRTSNDIMIISMQISFHVLLRLNWTNFSFPLFSFFYTSLKFTGIVQFTFKPIFLRCNTVSWRKWYPYSWFVRFWIRFYEERRIKRQKREMRGSDEFRKDRLVFWSLPRNLIIHLLNLLAWLFSTVNVVYFT